MFYSIKNVLNCLRKLFPIILKAYVMGVRSFFMFTLTVRGSTSEFRI